MATVRGLFGPFPCGCGTATAAMGSPAARSEPLDRRAPFVRLAGWMLVALIAATQLVLAVRGEDPTTVIAYALTTVCTAALLVRLSSLRGVG